MKQLLIISLSIVSLFSSCKTDTIESPSLSQGQELKLLQKQHANIVSLSESEECTSSNDWLFAPIGNKACGGPTGFIAYSQNIDTVNFLQLVEDYTLAQKNYNKKWGAISDCSTPPSPKRIICKNGVAVFVY